MVNRFNGELLMLARQIRKISQPQLVEMLGRKVSQAQLSKIEQGRIQPGNEAIEQIADALRFRASFFNQPDYTRMAYVSYHRKRQKLSSKDLESVHAQAEVYRINLKRLLSAVEFDTTLPPLISIDPDQFDGDIETIANTMRQRWSIPRGPIADLTAIMESAGVIIVSFDFGSPLIDGFCHHACDGLPAIVFMNSLQPKDRYRFSLAHELGHLVMHQTPNPEQEIQANRFASELLMPTRDIASQFYNLSLQKFMDQKLYWKVSMQALIYKAWQTGKISDRMFKYYNIEMSKRGFKSQEPIVLSNVKESPTFLREVLLTHINNLNYTAQDLSDLFGLKEEDFKFYYPMAYSRPQLRLVI